MPTQPGAHRPGARFRGRTGPIAVAAVLALPLVPTGFPAHAAQDEAARCAIPSTVETAVVATPRPPADDASAVRRATPAASPRPNVPLSDASLTPRPATPVATPPPTPVPTPDPQAVLEGELLATARALAACLSDGPAATAVRLATETYLGQLYAGGEPLTVENYLQLAPDLDPVPVRILALDDARRRGPDATAVVTSVVGNQLLREEWRFRPGAAGVPWQVDGASSLPVSALPDAVAVDVTLAEYAITIAGPATVGPDVVLRGTNAGAEDHEMLVLRFAPGFTAADLLRTAGPSLPDQAQWVGQTTLAAGATGDLVLTDMEQGTYTVVCLLPTVRGTPHLALGMAATFEVE